MPFWSFCLFDGVVVSLQGLYFPQESFEIAEMDMDRLTAQSLRLQFDTVTVRDLFRVLWTKYHLLKPHIGAVPRSLLEQLRSFSLIVVIRFTSSGISFAKFLKTLVARHF